MSQQTPRSRLSKDSITLKVVLFTLLFTLLPDALLVTFSTRESSRALQQASEEELRAKSVLMARYINRYLEHRVTAANVLSQAEVLRSNNLPAITQYLSKLDEAASIISNLALLDEAGRVLATSGKAFSAGARVGEVFPDAAPLFEQLRQNPREGVWVCLSRELPGGPGLLLIKPIMDQQAHVQKYFLKEVNLLDVYDMIDEFKEGLAGGKFIYLIDKSGRVIMSNQPGLETHAYFADFTHHPALLDSIGVQQGAGTLIYEDAQGEALIAGYADLTEIGTNHALDWSIVAIAPLHLITAPASTVAWRVGSIGLLISLLSVIIAYLFTQKTTRPLIETIQQLRQMAAGNFSQRLPARKGEVGQVARAVNLLADQLETTLSRLKQEIVERKQAEQAIRKSEELYRFVAELSDTAIGDHDLRTGTIRRVNDGIERVYGYPPDTQHTYQWWQDNIHPDDLQRVKRSFESALQARKRRWSATYRFYTFDRQVKYVEDEVIILYNQAGPYRLIGSMKDITFKVEAQKEQLRALIMGEENERKRLAAELHDGVGQILSLISLNLSAIPCPDDEAGQILKQKIRSTMELVNQSIEEVRSISHGLMPRALEDFGLEVVLESMLYRLDATSGINTHFEFNCRQKRFAPQVEINLYRIVQEALNNSLRHARPACVSLHIKEERKQLLLTYSDDGQGFDPEELKNRKGTGLKNIENRVLVLGGELHHIEAVPSKGFSMMVRIDLPG